MPNSASNVPPFIPGLFIVSLLIVVSVIVGWRNYSRRGNPRLTPGLGVWEFWEAEGEGGNTAERPTMWEVDVVGRPASEKGAWNDGWGNIMPLSATSLTPKSPPVASSLDSEASRNNATQNPSSPVSHPNFHAHKCPISSSLSPSPLPTTADCLQVAVLISMPSPRTRPQRSSTPSPASPECVSGSPPRASTSSSLWNEKIDRNHIPEEQEAEGSPEMALGVAVLPWWDDDATT